MISQSPAKEINSKTETPARGFLGVGTNAAKRSVAFTNAHRIQNMNCGENNFRLVRLLTTNPAAALPAIFSPSGKYEQRRIRMLPREHRIAPVHTQQPHRGFFQVPLAHDFISTPDGQFLVGLPLLPEKSYPGLYATEEEIEKKGSCSDDSGLFHLDAILPIDCKMKIENERTIG